MKSFVFSCLLFAAVLLPVSSSFTQPLPRSTPELQGISSLAVLDFVKAADEQIDMMNSFMLIRHGSVVAEAWWAPYEPESPHILYSLSKSFTSTAVGLAVAEGKLNISDPVLKFFPEDAPADTNGFLRNMRVTDLLRMNTGHKDEVSLRDDTKWTKAFLAHPVPFKPGTHFLYNTPATYMLSAIVQKVTGMTVLDYLRPRLFEPLGIANPTWGTSPQGITLGGFGLSIRTEDIARFGQLYLQKGSWNGKQLLPASWVDAATSLQTSNGSNPLSDWEQGYGYQFWISRNDAYRGDGAFGQYCIVIPNKDAVVAITSGVRDMQAVLNLAWDKLLPAMVDDSLPEDAIAQKHLTDSLSQLKVKTVAGMASTKLAQSVSGKWYTLNKNDRGIEAISFFLETNRPILNIRTSGREISIPIGFQQWKEVETPFPSGIEKIASGQPGPFPAFASGAWTSDDTYTIKMVYYETPFYTTINFKFAGEEVQVDSDFNVGFGPPKLPAIKGKVQWFEIP